MKTVGHVTSSDEGCFQWIIDDFVSHTNQCFGALNEWKSPDFKFSDSLCYICLYFDRENYLKLRFGVHETSHKLHVRLGMTTGYRGEKETRSGEVDTSGCFSAVDWTHCLEMLNSRCEILPNALMTVTISCKIRSIDIEQSASALSTEHPNAGEEKAIVENETSELHTYEEEELIIDLKVVRKLQKDLYSLLTTGEDSDVTLKVQGKEFPAHRNILRSRSPVFRSMFSHEMVEKQSGVVVIEDCDSVTFPDFLKYVYTGSTRHICDENVYHLYTASDKYGIDALKGECAKFMKNNLSVDRFCDTITLALRHSEKELVGFASAFFCENPIEITKTAKWQVFLHENTTAGNELFIKLLSREKIVKREKKFKK